MSTPVAGDSPELDLDRWRESDLLTDSLWLLGPRDRSGPPLAGFYGSFVPQIASQLIRRFSRPGDVVADLFLGAGTTLGACRTLGRHGIGVDLNPQALAAAAAWVDSLDNPHGVSAHIGRGDSTSAATTDVVRRYCADLGRPEGAALVILHPPYHDIISFGEDPRCLSRAASLEDFIRGFTLVAANARTICRPGGTVALVMGDKYEGGHLVPLGFSCMQACREAGLILKAVVIKDLLGNERGKGKNAPLWRYRHLKNGTFDFKHEYIFVFKRPKGGTCT